MSEANGTAREEDFGPSPHEWAQRWAMELAAARKELEKWHKQGDTVIKRFRDERDAKAQGETRWNLYWSNIQTQAAILYGKPPSVDVSRRFADAQDDVARVAGEVLERLLNTDLQADSDSCREAMAYGLMDRLLPGFASARVRYVPHFEKVPGSPARVDAKTGRELAPVLPDREVISDEQVETDYVHWKDMLWSPARVWHEVRWVAFRAEMSRRGLVERFGEVGKSVPLNAKRSRRNTSDEDAQKSNPWARSEVWEIWDKETRQVFWYVEGFDRVLDAKEDPLGLEGFWPCPRPMMANLTTSAMVPRPD